MDKDTKTPRHMIGADVHFLLLSKEMKANQATKPNNNAGQQKSDLDTETTEDNSRKTRKTSRKAKRARKAQDLADPMKILENILAKSDFKEANLSQKVELKFYKDRSYNKEIIKELRDVEYQSTVGHADVNVSVLPTGYEGEVNISPFAIPILPCINAQIPKRPHHTRFRKGKGKKKKNKNKQVNNQPQQSKNDEDQPKAGKGEVEDENISKKFFNQRQQSKKDAVQPKVGKGESRDESISKKVDNQQNQQQQQKQHEQHEQQPRTDSDNGKKKNRSKQVNNQQTNQQMRRRDPGSRFY